MLISNVRVCIRSRDVTIYKSDFDKIELLASFDIINYILVYICGTVIIDDFLNNDFMALILLKINQLRKYTNTYKIHKY